MLPSGPWAVPAGWPSGHVLPALLPKRKGASLWLQATSPPRFSPHQVMQASIFCLPCPDNKRIHNSARIPKRCHQHCASRPRTGERMLLDASVVLKTQCKSRNQRGFGKKEIPIASAHKHQAVLITAFSAPGLTDTSVQTWETSESAA